MLKVSVSEKSILKHINVIIYYVISLPLVSKNAVEARGKGESLSSGTLGLPPVSSAQPLKLCTLSAPDLS